MENKIKEILTKILGEEFSYSGEDMFEDGIIDSIEMMELIVNLEKTYGVEINAEDIIPENFKTVYTISELMKRILHKSGKTI